MAPPLLALRNATAVVGGKLLFEGIDAAVGRGDRICLVGRNGGGKSTLLRALAGMVDLDAGERFVQPRTTVAYLPQEPDLGTEGTVADHVLGGLRADEDPATGRYRAEVILERLGLAPDRPVGGLSGGEIRRAALARALIAQPEILLLDEPTNHLDLPAIERLEEDLKAY
ncbi:MAG TPA: ATP-binding cassette domain-containing protein, partial [Geminicoccaceae bacterium]|nr:ATP-binding cassette domain-containing protein [Geminicoccaceae bacterium]